MAAEGFKVLYGGEMVGRVMREVDNIYDEMFSGYQEWGLFAYELGGCWLYSSRL